MSRIIKPEGLELMRYLNEGYPICNKCGAVMNRKEHPTGRYALYTCPSCNWEIDVMDYEYEDDEKEKWSDSRNAHLGGVPVGCSACGGPYPQCKTSCKLFDD